MTLHGYVTIEIIYSNVQWHPTPVLLPGKSHGRRSLVGCSPWSRWGSGTTERLDFSLSCIGGENGNPLQCSCLENPRDRGAWWAAIYGVAQSRTWLKRFSSMHTMMYSLGHRPPLFYIPVYCYLLSCVRLFAWTHQAPLSVEFSGQEYWSGLPFPSPGDLPDPGIKPRYPTFQADSLPSEPPGK